MTGAVAQSAELPFAEALAKLKKDAPGTDGWTFDDSRVRWAVEQIRRSPIPERVQTWRDADRIGPGGRPEHFSVDALLAVMLLAAHKALPMLATTWADIMRRHVSPTMRNELGLPEPPDEDDAQACAAYYRTVTYRFHVLADLVDPSPYPKNRRLDPEEFQRRTKTMSPAEVTLRTDRLTWLINEILEISLRTLPRHIRRQWKGAIAVDGTPIPGFARPERKEPDPTSRTTPPKRRVLKHSADPDNGWYLRDGDHRDDDTTPNGGPPRKMVWAMEATLAVAGSDDDSPGRNFPVLAMGMSPLDKPGFRVGENAIIALSSVRSRGWPAGELGADRAYTNATPETFAYPARALGYRPVLDYRVDQLGIQDSTDGALQIEGALYSPGIPAVLVNATGDLRAGLIDDATYAVRIEERRLYRLRPNGREDEHGRIRMSCPAAKNAPTVQCEHKRGSIDPRKPKRPRIDLNHLLRTDPPTVCQQGSITVGPEAYGRLWQTLHYGSPEWKNRYATLRNTDEGAHGIAKDGARHAMADPTRRRIRGTAAQSILVAFLLTAMNFRSINTFCRKAEADEDGTLRVPRRPRRSTHLSLLDYEPTPATGDPP